MVGGLVVAGALASFVGPLASSEPDGLARVAATYGFDKTEERHPLSEGPVAGYKLDGVRDAAGATALAALAGVLVTFALGVGFFTLLRRRARSRARGGPS